MNNFLTVILLFGVGSLAGFINVMAGGGSSITLPILIFLGLESSLANGTNRVAIMIQNLVAVLSFRQEEFSEFKTSFLLAAFTLPGGILGAMLAVRINNVLFQKILAVVLIGILITVIFPKSKNADRIKKHVMKSWFIYPAMFLIGFYGGFIQVGVGFILMAALTHLLNLDLVRVNMHKVFIIFIYTIPAMLIFAFTGNVNWFYGLSLAAGNAFGAWWSAKIAVKKGEKVVRIILIVAMLFMSIKLFDLF